MPDRDSSLFRVTDLKQYLYCKRVLYYHACLPDVRPTTYKMDAGIEVHESEHKKALRRSLHVLDVESGVRHFDVNLVAPKLGLSGVIDEVIEVTAPNATFIPIEYKLSRQAGEHFQLQVVAYAMMLEECLERPVERGFIYLTPLKKSIEVAVTGRLRNSVKKALSEMHQIAKNEQIPDPADFRQKCVDCEFRRFCNDVF